jgi:hypothetical protein
VEAVGESSCRKAWKQALLLSERICFSSRAAVFSNRLLSGVRRRCQFLRSQFLFNQDGAIVVPFYIRVWGRCIPGCPLDCVVEVLTASCMSDSVLRRTRNCRRSLIRSRKASQFVFWL